jgi:hypothetical protein
MLVRSEPRSPKLLPTELLRTTWRNVRLILIVNKLESKICVLQTNSLVLTIFWPATQARVHFHTAKFEQNPVLLIDEVPWFVILVAVSLTDPH